MRYGVYVNETVTKREFDIGHAMEIDADEKKNEILKLIHTGEH